MSNFDVTAIGVAFVDVVANVTEDFLQQYSLTKGQGNILPISVLREIRRNLTDSRVIPGGTAANAMATVASLGGRAAFIGRLSNTISTVYAHWQRHSRINFYLTPLP